MTNPQNGLVPDSSRTGAPSSIAAVGMGLACYAVAAEREWLSRSEAAERVRTTLRTFWHGPGGHEPNAIGHCGFFYHFLDMESGLRAWRSEVSTIDTAIFLAGALTARRGRDPRAPRRPRPLIVVDGKVVHRFERPRAADPFRIAM